MTKPLFIVNPKSGGGRATPFDELRGPIERRLGEVDAVFTERRGDATRLAREAAHERELVVAVGGDGTISDVVDGLVRERSEARLGVLGQGTGGDFRKSLGLEHRLDHYLDALANGRDRSIDVGHATFPGAAGERTDRYFVNILSAGMGGLVDEYVSRGSRLFGGTAAYFLASTRALVDIERATLRLTLDDGEREVTSYMLAICNGQYFGSGMHVAPMAQLDDGRFEVVSMDASSKVAFATFSRQIYTGAHMQSRNVTHLSCARITVDLVPASERARPTFRLDVDGEPLGHLPLEVEVLPRRLTVRC